MCDCISRKGGIPIRTAMFCWRRGALDFCTTSNVCQAAVMLSQGRMPHLRCYCLVGCRCTRGNKCTSCDNWRVEYWHKVWELYADRLQGFRFAAVYCRKPFILPKLVLFFGTFLELPVLPSIICAPIVPQFRRSCCWLGIFAHSCLFPTSCDSIYCFRFQARSITQSKDSKIKLK